MFQKSQLFSRRESRTASQRTGGGGRSRAHGGAKRETLMQGCTKEADLEDGLPYSAVLLLLASEKNRSSIQATFRTF